MEKARGNIRDTGELHENGIGATMPFDPHAALPLEAGGLKKKY